MSVRNLVRRPGRLLVVLLLLVPIGWGSVLIGRYLWANWHERKGRQQAAQYDFDAAYYHFSRCLSVWNDNAAVHLEAARAARRARRFELVEEHLRMFQKSNKQTSAEQQLEQKLLEAQNGDLKNVEPSLKEYIYRKAPEETLVMEALADAYLRMQRVSDAESLVKKMLEDNPENVSALYLTGRVLAASRRESGAKEVFDRVLKLQPNHLGTHRELSALLLESDPSAAMKHVHVLRERLPDDSEMKFRQVLCHKELGETEAGVKLLDEMIKDDPNNLGLLVERGVLAMELSDPAGAEEWLGKALEQSPYNHEANFRLAQAILQQGGRKAEAEKLLELCNRLKRIAILKHMPPEKLMKNAELLHECGALMMQSGQEKEALSWLYQALEQDQNRQETHRVLADYYAKTGQREEYTRHQQFLQKKDR
jgi:predicted Zn-dependent protease